jgi:alpha-galactosidase
MKPGKPHSLKTPKMKKNMIIVFVCFKLLIQNGYGTTTRYEAENACLYNGAGISNGANYSGGKKVGWLGGTNNGTVEFKNVTGQFRGFHRIILNYASDDQRNFSLACNEGEGWQNKCPATGGWDTVGAYETYVFLIEGINTIKVNNPDGNAPDLDFIEIDQTQYQLDLHSVSGIVTNASHEPSQGTKMILSGANGYSLLTDIQGMYEFKIFPNTHHTIAPVKTGSFFIPSNISTDGNIAVSKSNDFIFKTLTGDFNDTVFAQGNWKIQYFSEIGSASIYYKNELLLPYSYSEFKEKNTITSRQYANCSFTVTAISDKLGDGKKLAVKLHGNREEPEMTQEFLFYENLDCIFTRIIISKAGGMSTNYMAPVVCDSMADFLGKNDRRVLAVPFDNDSWVRYDAQPFTENLTSYEVSAMYDNASRCGLVIGSVEHNYWKTGIISNYADNSRDLKVFGGITSPLTRDVLDHGKVSGETVSSPMVYIGFGADWRKLMETYASINNVIAPGLAWNQPKPFGWNSWGKIQDKLTYAMAISVSDFFARELQPQSFNNEGQLYIGLDSYWDRLSDEQLKLFVQRCRQNGQEAGIYWAPFTYWGGDDARVVEGGDGLYKYQDVYLYANGNKQIVDGAPAIDPTHPAVKDRARYYINKFMNAGFSYIKLDFLGHGSLEADRHFDTSITTGIQAYNLGMKHMVNLIDGKMFINASIAPLFPSNYAHSRRIACDTYGSMRETEYALNSLTYGWWLSYAYRFNDADHIVLTGNTEGENRARVTSSAISGIFISGDDFSTNGVPDGKEKAKKFLTNSDINNMARIKKSFMPVEGNTNEKASNLFVYNDLDNNCFYLAAFNFGSASLTEVVDFSRIGFNITDSVFVKELWSGKVVKEKGCITLNIPGLDVGVFKFSADPLIVTPTGFGQIER